MADRSVTDQARPGASDRNFARSTTSAPRRRQRGSSRTSSRPCAPADPWVRPSRARPATLANPVPGLLRARHGEQRGTEAISLIIEKTLPLAHGFRTVDHCRPRIRLQPPAPALEDQPRTTPKSRQTERQPGSTKASQRSRLEVCTARRQSCRAVQTSYGVSAALSTTSVCAPRGAAAGR